jgi:hypothetical protein
VKNSMVDQACGRGVADTATKGQVIRRIFYRREVFFLS